MLEFDIVPEPVEHMVEQGTEEWKELRIGKLTGSTFPDIMRADKPKMKWTQGQLTVLRKVAAEILTGESSDKDFKTVSMEWGNVMEPIARETTQNYLKMDVRECGFFEYSPMVGASPDGIAGDMDLTLELKCPDSQTHLLYYLDPEALWKKYRWQAIGEMFCTGIGSGIIASFDPRMPSEKQLVVVEPPKGYRDDIKRLEDRLSDACVEIARMIK